jgi:farnesyl diphosphate synthase
MTLNDFVTHTCSRIELTFKQYLMENPSPALTLQKAVEYATLNSGKRIRPLLVYLIGRTLGSPWENLDPAASAVELIHVYSLIHDDLPAMDNSDLRRGKPSCHKAFDEATAILAGDALQPLAFEIITTHPSSLTAQQRLDMIKILSQASGIHGMAAGQMLDIEKTSSIDSLTQMYQLKTGALLNAAVKLGVISAGVSDPNIFNSLHIFAENIGLAFQIQDDLLDIEGASLAIGKPQGIDQANQKTTHLTLLGIEKSRKKIEMLFDTAVRSLNFLGEKNNLLCEFANMLMQRTT